MQPSHPAPSPRQRRRRIHRTIVLVLIAAFFVPIGVRAADYYFDEAPRSWSRANWDSIGSLPPAAEHPEARVLVLSARTGGWRGVFAVHSWIVAKPENGARWTRYDVVGWGNPVRTNGWAPDGRWRGNDPVVSTDVRGAAAQTLIPKIETAVKDYQWSNAGDYRAWPGPNSNTFVANVLRAVPEMNASLPANAVGRDFRPEFYFGFTDSRSGIELNLWGFAGFKLGWVEGFELNFLGLVTGFDFRAPAIKLPGFGNVGLNALDWTATADEQRAK
jgi:hypothetical protein